MTRTSWLERSGSPAARLAACIVVVSAVGTAPAGSGRGTLVSLVVAMAVVVAASPSARWIFTRGALAMAPLAALIAPLALESPESAAWLAVRSILATLVALGFAATLGGAELPRALRGLGVPASLSRIIETMTRQIATAGSDLRRLVLARRLRGARFAASVDAVAVAVGRGAVRAERIGLAMRLRGATRASCARPGRLRLGDARLLALAAAFAVAAHAGARAAT